MAMPEGPLAYRSRHPGLPLTEGEEALLAFAACGITGAALADLTYAPGQGATIMAGLLGRTIGSGAAIQSVAVVVTNAEATYLLKRPRDFARGEKPPGTEMFRTPARRALRFWKSCDVPPGVRAGALGMRVEPPLGDRVRAPRLAAVRLEERGDAPHRVRAPRTGRQENGGSGWRAFGVVHASLEPGGSRGGRQRRWC
jgi:hypothetical protein